jgi:hypothetical protein
MRRKVRVTLLIIVAIVVTLAVAVAAVAAIGTSRFRVRYEEEKAGLLRRGRAAPGGTIEAGAIAALPPPVRRYLEVTETAGKPRPRVAILAQRGELRTAADRSWMPFDAEQVYAMDPPGFVWLARARVAPLLHMMARDRFVDARGHMLVRLLGAITVADATGPGIDQGAALRHWGEVLVFPENALDRHLRWEPIDEQRARLHVVQEELSLTAVVEFDEAGLPVATHAERYRDVGGEQVLTRWSGHSRDWKVIDGRLFPSRWESVWHLPEGDFTAVRMEILSIRTE